MMLVNVRYMEMNEERRRCNKGSGDVEFLSSGAVAIGLATGVVVSGLASVGTWARFVARRSTSRSSVAQTTTRAQSSGRLDACSVGAFILNSVPSRVQARILLIGG